MSEPAIVLEAGIVAVDAEALAAFYRDGFGFEVESVRTFPQGAVHRLVREDARLKIFQPAEAPRDRGEVEPWHRDQGFAYGSLHVRDIAAEVARAEEHGATVRTGVTNHRPGAHFALVADPEGNVWEVLQEDPAP